MVRDKNGRKMSKSTGNVIDPMEVIHGCLLSDLLKKIDEGNLPEKEVSKQCVLLCAFNVKCMRRSVRVCFCKNLPSNVVQLGMMLT